MRTTAFLILAGVALVAGAQTPTPAPAAAPVPPPPTLGARSFVLLDFDSGQVLAAREPELPVEPASITKVMTSYIVAAELAAGKVKLDDPVFISENAWRRGGAGTDGSTSFLQVKSSVPLEVLLRGMVVQSGNDASIALAEHLAGSEETFAGLMNEHAARRGLAGTRYLNATGLPADGHVTTALDVARLGRALIRDFPEHYKQYSTREYTWNGITQHNRNTLLWRDPSVDGIKTGHTSRAGYCLATSAKRGDMRLIAVVMGTASEKARSDESQALLNYGFRFFESTTVYRAGVEVAAPDLWKGVVPKARLGLAADARVAIPRGSYDRLQATINVPNPLLAPLVRGQQVGDLQLRLGDRLVHEGPLVALEDYPEGGFFKRLGDALLLWWSSD
ncbi:MAG: D-alanyl-D-alanine carboxypeptidase family protein [Pseudomonadota bacterium]